MPEINKFPTAEEIESLSGFMERYTPDTARKIFGKMRYALSELERLNQIRAASLLRKANEGPFETQYAHEV